MFQPVRKKMSRRYLDAKAITDSANRLQYAWSVGTVELLSEVLDVDIDDIAKSLVIEVPEMGEQVLTVHHLVRVTHEVLEKAKLFQGETDLISILLYDVTYGIELKAADREH